MVGDSDNETFEVEQVTVGKSGKAGEMAIAISSGTRAKQDRDARRARREEAARRVSQTLSFSKQITQLLSVPLLIADFLFHKTF